MYRGVFNVVLKYWNAYGGIKALFSSIYLHVAFVLLIVTFHFWMYESWWDQTIAILPNLLGFSLGGLAMLVGFGNEKFLKFISTREEDGLFTPYVSVSATFVHFMLLQVVALLLAIVFRSLNFEFPWPRELLPFVKIFTAIAGGFSYLLFLYSVTSMVAAIFAIFRVTTWFEEFQNSDARDENVDP